MFAGLPVRRAATFALGVFLVVRIALFLFGLLAVSLIPPADPADVPGREADPVDGEVGLLDVWERWDALWYLRIATDGYEADDGSAAFFPLYPLLVRLFTWAFLGNELLAGTFVSNLAAYASLVLLYLLTTREFGETAGRRSTIYLSVFPTAFFLYAPYSESLFLALALAAFLAARQRAWLWAGTAGALAAATRSLGIVLVGALAIEALHQARNARDGRLLLRSLPASALPASGLAAYMAFWWVKARDALVPFHAQSDWSRDLTFPLATPINATKLAFRWIWQSTGGYHLLDWILTVPAIAGAAWTTFRARPTYTAYVWVSLLVPFLFAWDARPFMSLPRFALVMFPMYWAGAAWAAKRPGVHEAIIAVSAVLLGINALLFVNWYYMF